MISAEGSNVGDANALITRSYATVHAASPTTTLTSTADLYLTGFAPAGISITAAAAGNFGGGITIWTGSGNDHITVDATHYRAGVNEVTTLNTGLGNDNVTVNLTDGVDGAFVLDAQGPDENLLHLGDPVQTGDYNTPADTVGVSRRRIAAHLRPVRRRRDRSTRSGSWSARSRARGRRHADQAGRDAVHARPSHTVSLGTALQNLGPNDTVSATVNGAAVDASQMTIDPLAGNVTFANDLGAAGRRARPDRDHPAPHAAVRAAAGRPSRDNDIVDASGSTLPDHHLRRPGQRHDHGRRRRRRHLRRPRPRPLVRSPARRLPAIPQDGVSRRPAGALENTAVAVAGGGGPATDGMTRLWGLAAHDRPVHRRQRHDQRPGRQRRRLRRRGQRHDQPRRRHEPRLRRQRLRRLGGLAGRHAERDREGRVDPARQSAATTRSPPAPAATSSSAAPATTRSRSARLGTNIVLGDNGSIIAARSPARTSTTSRSCCRASRRPSSASAATTTSPPAPATRSSSAARATTRSAPAPARTSSSATTAGSTGARPDAADRPRRDLHVGGRRRGRHDHHGLRPEHRHRRRGRRHDQRRHRHEHRPGRQRRDLRRRRQPVAVRLAPDHGRHGRDDRAGHRRRRPDHRRQRQRDRHGRHRRRRRSPTGTNTSFVFGDDGYITWIGAIYNPENLDVAGRTTATRRHRPRRLDRSDGRRERQIIDRRGPARSSSAARRTTRSPAAPARTSSSATTGGSSPPARTRARSASCRSRSAWSRRRIRASAATTTIQTGTGSAIVMGGTGADQSRPSSAAAAGRHQLRLRRRRLHHLGRLRAEPGEPVVGGREQRPDEHRPRRLHRRRATAATTRSRSARAARSSSAAQGDDTITGGSGTNIILGDSGAIFGVGRQPAPVRDAADHARPGRDDAPGHRRQRHDLDRRRQRGRVGRHRRRQRSPPSTARASSSATTATIDLDRRELNPESPPWAGANSDPTTSTSSPRPTPPTAATTRSRSAPARRSSSAARVTTRSPAAPGTNVILGDNGEIYGVAGNPNPFGRLPITLGLVETTAAGHRRQRHDHDRLGQRVVFGGTGADTIHDRRAGCGTRLRLRRRRLHHLVSGPS